MFESMFRAVYLLIAQTQSVTGESDIVVPSAADVPPIESHTVFSLILGAGAVVKLVLLMLLIMSVVTWGIVISKAIKFRKARDESKEFSDLFWNSRNLAKINDASKQLTHSPVATVFSAGHKELTQILKSENRESGGEDLDNIDRALKRAKAEQINRLESGTTFLATTASAAPFIGLFGTVWGIMNAFIGLSQVKSSSIQAVAPGISEALIATAIGLAAAIPAAIAYNYFNQQVKILARNMDMFAAEFLNIAGRHFL